MNYDTKQKLSRVGAILMACVLVGGALWSTFSSILKENQTNQAVYPAMVLYDGEYYAMTGMEALELPDDVTRIYVKSAGDQSMIPSEDGTCNFGKGVMSLEMGDGKAYFADGDGDWLICEKITLEE